MSFSKLPAEILLAIAESLLPSSRNLNALIRTTRYIYSMLNHILYRHNVQSQESSALQWAAQTGQTETTRMLLAHNANINITSSKGETLFILAAREGHTDILNILLAASSSRNGAAIKADPQARDKNGWTALWYTARNGHTECVRVLLTLPGVDPAHSSEGAPDHTPLHMASRNGHVEIVELLLATGRAEPNRGLCILEAVRGGHTRIVQRLIEHGVDPARGGEGVNEPPPLCLAIQHDHAEVVELLLQTEGVDPTQMNPMPAVMGRRPQLEVDGQEGDDQCTPLMLAARLGHTEVVRTILCRVPEQLNVRDLAGRTALFHAAEMGKTAVVGFLLAQRAVRIDLPDKAGQTPLCAAARAGYARVVEVLSQVSGIDVNARDRKGQTPLLAALSGRGIPEEVVRALLTVDGVQIHCTDSYGRTPLLWCKWNNDRQTKELLLRYAEARGSRYHPPSPSISDRVEMISEGMAFNMPLRWRFGRDIEEGIGSCAVGDH